MSTLQDAPVPVRSDLSEAHEALWDHISRPGPTLTGEQRIALLHAAREDAVEIAEVADIDPAVAQLAADLLNRPRTVDESTTRRAADAASDATTVETIGLISMLSAIDATHVGLGLPLPSLPNPMAGPPTGEIADGLKRRRTHIPVPPGQIPVVLDLLPPEGVMFRSLFGPHYMTEAEMGSPTFERSPGLNRAQIELISSRTSFINECFY